MKSPHIFCCKNCVVISRKKFCIYNLKCSKKFPCRMTWAFCLPTRFQVHYTFVFLRPRRLFWAIWFRISTEEQKKGNISGAYHFEKVTNCSWKWVIWKRKIGLLHDVSVVYPYLSKKCTGVICAHFSGLFEIRSIYYLNLFLFFYINE